MNLETWRKESPLLADFDDKAFEFLESVAEPLDIKAGEILFRVNSPADRFFIVTNGIVGLTIAGPTGPPSTIQTFGPGSLIGLSWRIPPYRWQWTAQAVEDASLAVFDANTVLTACETDPEFDARIMRVVAAETARRLHSVRLQLLDLYGKE